METSQVYSGIESHVRDFFGGHAVTEFVWPLGPVREKLPRFRVLRMAPGPVSNLWVYVSLGAWEVDRIYGSGMEFMILAPQESLRHVELLAMSAYYHSNHHLGLGHTYPIGEPWLESSLCDHFLVSRPYPFGQELELYKWDDQHVHLYWLLPITATEREFKMKNGLAALEDLFEERGLEYWRVERASVV